MKKLIAILLLAIYLFNLAGYSLVFHYFIRQSDEKFTQQLDENNYKDAELVQISIPFNLPYTQNSSQFQRLDGSIELNGVVYNYVKRRIYNDTLYIMCLPNKEKAQLTKAKTTYAGEANDFATSKKQKESPAKKAGPGTEYNNSITQYSFVVSAEIAAQHATGIVLPAVSTPIDRPEHPPQISC